MILTNFSSVNNTCLEKLHKNLILLRTTTWLDYCNSLHVWREVIDSRRPGWKHGWVGLMMLMKAIPVFHHFHTYRRRWILQSRDA